MEATINVEELKNALQQALAHVTLSGCGDEKAMLSLQRAVAVSRAAAEAMQRQRAAAAGGGDGGRSASPTTETRSRERGGSGVDDAGNLPATIERCAVPNITTGERAGAGAGAQPGTGAQLQPAVDGSRASSAAGPGSHAPTQQEIPVWCAQLGRDLIEHVEMEIGGRRHVLHKVAESLPSYGRVVASATAMEQSISRHTALSGFQEIVKTVKQQYTLLHLEACRDAKHSKAATARADEASLPHDLYYVAALALALVGEEPAVSRVLLQAERAQDGVGDQVRRHVLCLAVMRDDVSLAMRLLDTVAADERGLHHLVSCSSANLVSVNFPLPFASMLQACIAYESGNVLNALLVASRKYWDSVGGDSLYQEDSASSTTNPALFAARMYLDSVRRGNSHYVSWFHHDPCWKEFYMRRIGSDPRTMLYAVQSGSEHTLRKLMEAGCVVKRSGSDVDLLSEAVARCDASCVERSDKDWHKSERCAEKFTILKVLLHAGADVHASDAFRNAVEHTVVPALEILLRFVRHDSAAYVNDERRNFDALGCVLTKGQRLANSCNAYRMSEVIDAARLLVEYGAGIDRSHVQRMASICISPTANYANAVSVLVTMIRKFRDAHE